MNNDAFKTETKTPLSCSLHIQCKGMASSAPQLMLAFACTGISFHASLVMGYGVGRENRHTALRTEKGVRKHRGEIPLSLQQQCFFRGLEARLQRGARGL